MTAPALSRRIGRRSLLKGGAGSAAALVLLKASQSLGAPAAHAASAGVAPGPLAWVWRFGEDGSPAEVRDLLAAHGIGVILKAFDGVNWMAKYDKNSPMPMTGPEAVHQAAVFFETAGVPFHAWCVVNGEDPIREAQMASAVLDAGARTLSFDLELPEGTNYWQAGPAEAAALGAELRRLQPNAYLTVAPDARPWQVEKLPMAEFAAFCNDIAPQTYWETFNTPANHKKLAQYGFPIGPEGLTPELIVDATFASLQRHGRPVRPIGQGAATAAGWQRFTAHSAALGMSNLSTWRVGTTLGEVWPVLSLTDTTKVAAAPPPSETVSPPPPVPPEGAVVEQPAVSATPGAGVASPDAAATSGPTPELNSETSSTRSTTSTPAPGTVNGRNNKTEWHERMANAIRTAKPFGLGGK